MRKILSQILNQIFNQNKLQNGIEQDDRSLLIVSIRGDLEEIRDQFSKLKNTPFDLLEICPSSYDVLALKIKIKNPWILTYKRGPLQTKENYLQDLEKFVLLNPTYVDIDHEDFEFISKNLSYTGKWIISFHDFTSNSYTVDELHRLYEELSHSHTSHIKIALSPTSQANALSLFFKARQIHKLDQKLIFVCIGERYSWTRIVSSRWNVGATYCCIDGFQRYGQISIQELVETYGYFKHSVRTKVYALLGDPVHQSLSHITHNKIFQELDLNALYCKIPMSEEEASPFLEMAKIRFSGFSITMPLKRALIPNEIINTIYQEHLQFSSANTDAPSVLALIKEKGISPHQSILILGTGSTAQAIAGVLFSHGWKQLTMLSRNPSSKHLKEINVIDYESWITTENRYDLVINTTPPNAGFSKLIQKKLFESRPLYFEVNYNPPLTSLIQKALEMDCPVIWGIELFTLQASLQMALWFQLGSEEQKNIRKKIIAINSSLFPKVKKLPRQIHETTCADQSK